MAILKYKGHIATVEYSRENDEFFGTIINVSNVSASKGHIHFRGPTVEELAKHMKEVINEHIENFEKLGLDSCPPCTYIYK